ncbi:MAG: cupin domain-containing protein [Parvularculaceae bacterium]
MMPGGATDASRTGWYRYGIVLSGALELELDDGDKTRLGPGDIVVQRGTMHRWRNLSETEPCRIAFVLIEAPAYVQHGTPLPETKP